VSFFWRNYADSSLSLHLTLIAGLTPARPRKFYRKRGHGVNPVLTPTPAPFAGPDPAGVKIPKKNMTPNFFFDPGPARVKNPKKNFDPDPAGVRTPKK